MMANTQEVLKHAQWLTWYLYNESVTNIFDKVYDNSNSNDYILEKEDVFYADRLSWFANLDSEHKEKLIEQVIKRYDK